MTEKQQPLIKQGWLRALLFVIALFIISILVGLAKRMLLASMENDELTNVGQPGGQDILSGKFMLINLLASFLAFFITLFLFLKLVDRRTLSSLGLKWKSYESHAATGFFIGILLLGTGSFILIVNKNLQWTDITFDANEIFIGFGLMMVIALTEELVFRGYILNNLMQSMNKWTALVVSALLFALFHFNNPEISTVALLNIFVAGLMLGINYIYTKNLWFSILLHFSWNFYQGSILGYEVSGWNLQSLLQQELTGNDILTGGSFGFEGSVLDGSLSLITILVLAWIYEKRFSAPPLAT